MPPRKRALAEPKNDIKSMLEEKTDPNFTFRGGDVLIDRINSEADLILLLEAEADVSLSRKDRWIQYCTSLESLCLALESSTPTSSLSRNIFALYNASGANVETSTPNEITVRLLQSKADPNILIQSSLYPGDTISRLVKAKADVNILDSKGRSALHKTLDHDNVKLLIKSNANPNIRDKYQLYPLHIAANEDNTESIVELLLNAKAKCDVETKDKETPLFLHMRNPNSVQLLLNAKANPHVKNSAGDYVIHRAAPYHESLKLLMDAKADIHSTNFSRSTPLLLAVKNSQSVQLLIDAKADYNQTQTTSITTPLHRAVQYPSTLRVLLDAKADVHTLNGLKQTAGHCAIQYYDSLLMLLHAGCDVLEPVLGKTAAHDTARHPQELSLLINLCINLNICDDKGRLPIELSYGNTKTLYMFLEAGANPILCTKKPRVTLAIQESLLYDSLGVKSFPQWE